MLLRFYELIKHHSARCVFIKHVTSLEIQARVKLWLIALASCLKCWFDLVSSTYFNLIFDNFLSNALSLLSSTSYIRLASFPIIYYVCMCTVRVVGKHYTRLLPKVNFTCLRLMKMIWRGLEMRFYPWLSKWLIFVRWESPIRRWITNMKLPQAPLRSGNGGSSSPSSWIHWMNILKFSVLNLPPILSLLLLLYGKIEFHLSSPFNSLLLLFNLLLNVCLNSFLPFSITRSHPRLLVSELFLKLCIHFILDSDDMRLWVLAIRIAVQLIK